MSKSHSVLPIVPGLLHCWYHLMPFCFALALICFWLNLSLVLSCLLNPRALAVDFEQVIVPVICFLVICFLPCLLTRYWLFYVSSRCVSSFVSFAFPVCSLNLNRSSFRFYYIWHCLLTRHWFGQCQQHLYIEIILQSNSGSMAADFEQVTVSIRLFFTWLMCIYIILDKGCHILCFWFE